MTSATVSDQAWLSGYDVLKAHARAALTTANNVGSMPWSAITRCQEPVSTTIWERSC